MQNFTLENTSETEKKAKRRHNRRKRRARLNSKGENSKSYWNGAVSSVYQMVATNIKSKKKNKKRKEKAKKRKERLKQIPVSLGEAKIAMYLTSKKIIFQREKEYSDLVNPETNQRLRFDFYLPNRDVCIEYDGPQHSCYTPRYHGNSFEKAEIMIKNQQYRDSIKDNYCQDRDIKLIRISYKDFGRIEEILEEKLNLREGLLLT